MRNDSPFNPLILGKGPCSVALSRVFRAPQIIRSANDSGWGWQVGGMHAPVTFILVADPGLSISRIIRHHADAWECPEMKKARCVIIALDEGLVPILLKRDVFGRTGQNLQSFSFFSRYIAILPARIGLLGLLRMLGNLEFCPVPAWRDNAEEASVIPPLCAALSSCNISSLMDLLPLAVKLDWDALCHSHPDFGEPHAYANRIRLWLGAVTSGVTPDWLEGEMLFGALQQKRQKRSLLSKTAF